MITSALPSSHRQMTRGKQVSCTPWRSESELCQVRAWLYPEKTSSGTFVYGIASELQEDEADAKLFPKRRACDTVYHAI